MSKKTIVLLICPQVDFHEGGSLQVIGANADSERTKRMIVEHAEEIDEVFVMMDSHHRNHIAHAVFWANHLGESPGIYTQILADQVGLGEGQWRPRDPSLLEHAKWYTKELARRDKFKLTIWPEHCLLGTEGHSVVDSVNEALQHWADVQRSQVHYVLKGQNCLTEMYSAIEAEVPLPSDPATHTDRELLEELQEADRLIVCGQAMSHCVKETVGSLIQHWGGDLSQITVLKDACSPVTGFEAAADDFVKEAASLGVRMSTTTEAFDGWHRSPARVRPAGWVEAK